jgi:hypothetical protein
MSTPTTKSLQCIAFYTLGRTGEASLEGETIAGTFREPLTELRARKGTFLSAEFVSWGNSREDILRFTQQYAPLHSIAIDPRTGFPLPQVPPFRFNLRDWQDEQRHFREVWEALMKMGVRQLFFQTPTAPGDSLRMSATRFEYQTSSLNRLMNLELLYSIPTNRLRICRCELSDCPQRYFVARHLGQRYASPSCAETAQRKWKSEWWADHGDHWRKKRQERTSAPAKKKSRRGVK